MSRRGWTVAGIAGGVVGAAGAVAGVGVASQRRKIAAARFRRASGSSSSICTSGMRSYAPDDGRAI